MNKKFWEGLPVNTRTELDKAMKEATDYANEVADKDNEDALKAMKASGKTDFFQPTAAEREALCKLMQPVYEQMGDRVGKDLIATIQKEVATK